MSTETVPNSEIIDEIKEIENRINELKETKEFGEKIRDLHDNNLFQEVIIDGYFEKEAHRIFGLLVTPTTLKRDAIENIVDKLAGIRNLKSFFAMHLRNLEAAAQELEELENYLAKLRNLKAEGVEDGE